MVSKYDEMLEEYLQEGINWYDHKNEVIKTANKSELAKGDVEQFASDSYWQGWQDAKSENANCAIFDVSGLLPLYDVLELNILVTKLNNKEIDLREFVSDVWNTAYRTGYDMASCNNR